MAAEAVTSLRDRLTEAVLVAARRATHPAAVPVDIGLVDSSALVEASAGTSPAAVSGSLDEDPPLIDPWLHGERHATLHLVPATRPPAAATTSLVTARQRGDEPAGEPASADSERRMRAYWDTEVAEGRVPSGAELAKAGDVSPATGRRRRAAWEAELVTVPGGGLDASA
jgi:hypothetical protein